MIRLRFLDKTLSIMGLPLHNGLWHDVLIKYRGKINKSKPMISIALDGKDQKQDLDFIILKTKET